MIRQFEMDDLADVMKIWLESNSIPKEAIDENTGEEEYIMDWQA